jgi:hypothetical protein
MRLVRRIVPVLLLALVAACGGDFLDPKIAGQWGGENLELRFKPGVTEIHFPCDGVGTLQGDVDVNRVSGFSVSGKLTVTSWAGTSSFNARLSGIVTGSSMVVRLSNTDVSNDEPEPVALQRGQDGTFTLFCATGR